MGVFGAGRGMSMISQIMNHPDAELVAVCDKYVPLLDNCRRAAADRGLNNITFYERFDDFIQHDMDAVVLANYAHEHAKFGIRLLESGRHIMTECLVSANLAEAVQLVETVEKTGKIYTYAENYCYTPARLEMKRRYRNGDFGTLMYAEGEYLHDCSSIWPQITYGERNHWRNPMPSTFYSTHAIGPLLYMTGLRPTRVVGFETPNMPFMRKLGTASGTFGGQMLVLENGAFAKTLQFGIKHVEDSHYQLEGDLGGIKDLGYDDMVKTYIEQPDMNGRGERTTYKAKPVIEAAANSGHGGADFYTTHYFISSILGDEEAKKAAIDVYQACDMSMPGILAYRSILEGNTPQYVPNFRLKEDRDKYRHDTFCTFPEAAGDMYVSNNAYGDPEIPDEVFDEVRRRWEKGLPG